MSNFVCRPILPTFIRHSNDAASLRATLMTVLSGPGSWSARRNYVNESFKPLLTRLEAVEAPADVTITASLKEYDAPTIQALWAKALDRRTVDPEGAVTAASTLLEDVCKHIIEDSGSAWDSTWNIPKLYSEAAKNLNLAPSQHQEVVFKTILGNCQSIVQSIGSLRNKGGDAHAGGRSRIAYKPRHAVLTVNLAGSMALFLVETYRARIDAGSTSTSGK
jgi:hypothetical protein